MKQHSSSFRDRVVLITGAAGGIGSALARRFGAAGWRLALLDIDSDRLQAVHEQLTAENFDALPMVCDLTDFQACSRAVEAIVRHFGRIDVLINNAGITHRSAFADTQPAVFRRVMEVNFFGALHCTKAALPHLAQSRGTIVVISSIAGFSPLYGRSGYAASKYALHGLFESLRTELAGTGVHILLVCPGFTATDIEKRALDADGSFTTHPRSTTGRIARPEEVAAAVYRATLRRRRLLVLSTVGKLAYWISRLAPALYERIMRHRLRHELQR